LINITASSGPATLVITRTLARDTNTNEIVVTFTIANTGGAAATAVRITAAKIGAIATTTALPLAIADIPGGGSSSGVLRFPAATGAPGAAAVLSITGSDSSGGLGGSARVTLP
jgi:uncharacterized protein (TIGR02588 family)